MIAVITPEPSFRVRSKATLSPGLTLWTRSGAALKAMVIAGHDHRRGEVRGLELSTGGYQDAHELAHANDIRRRFAGREVTTGQIVVFGLTGGLIPCPGAITVLLLCLQLKEFALGAVLVLCFSIGLALTMVASGVIAALSVKQVSKRWSGFGEIVRKAPYLSGAVILVIGVYIGVNGWLHLSGGR